MLGSFTETLLLHSPIPILTVNPEAKEIRTIDHILFPTDLGEQSEKFLETTLALARDLGADLFLLHKFEPWLFPVRTPANDLQKLIHQELITLKDRALDWTEKARREGVRAHLLFDDSAMSVTDAILHHAQVEDIMLISMEAHTSTVPGAVLSSVTRQVLRQAQVPVLMLKQS